MTTMQLSALIAIAVLLQLAIWGLFSFRRHWSEYEALRRRVAAGEGASSAATRVGPVTAPVAWEGYRDFRVVRKVAEDRDGQIRSFHLVPVDGAPLPPFRPGQYLTFRLAVDDPAGGGSKTIVRCYSLSDRPHPDHYRVSIKRVPAPKEHPGVPAGLSSNHFHDHVEEGTLLSVRAPSGHFFLDQDSSLPIVLVGGGIGITPMLSILHSVLEEAPRREVWLFYGVRDGGEAVMVDALKALAERHPQFHLQLCYSRPAEGEVEGVDYHHRGRVDIARLRMTLPLRRHQFYVCGPKAMMESLVPALEDWGVADEDIHYESFGPASLAHREPRAPVAATGAATVTFAKSGKRLPWDGRHDSLLALAEANGIAVESGCRAGSCGCCMTAVAAGEVAYSQQPDAEVAPGHCLLCVSTPKGDLTLDA